jgi:hypothetical protein
VAQQARLLLLLLPSRQRGCIEVGAVGKNIGQR